MQHFTSKYKLKKMDEFSSVFLFRKNHTGLFLKIYFKPTNFPNSRLGLIVSKKISKRANKRNYMKRILRELFRKQQNTWLLSNDIIIKVIKFFDKNSYELISQEFLHLTNKIFF